MTFNKLNKFIKLSFRDKLFFLRTLFLLLFSKLVILFIPLKKVAPHLGHLNGNIRKELGTREKEQAERVKLFIYMVGGNIPWQSVCLDQAMVGMILLKRRKIPCNLCLGVKKDELKKKLDAHAWIECGDKILIGGQRSLLYTKVAHFSTIL